MTAVDRGRGARLVVEHDGTPLHGEIRLDGAKHAFAHVLASAAMHPEARLTNVPDIVDSAALVDALGRIFKTVVHDRDAGVLEVGTPRTNGVVRFDSDLLSRSRSLFCLLPAALHHVGRVELEGLPQGCDIGVRPTNWYLRLLESFGVRCATDGAATTLTWPSRRSAVVEFAYPSMTGSVMAVAMASGVDGASVLRGLSVEPSVHEQVEAAGANGVIVEPDPGGPDDLLVRPGTARRFHWDVGCDRIHAVTLLCAGLLTWGDVTVTFTRDLRIPRFVEFCAAIGANVEAGPRFLRVGHPLTRSLAANRLHAGSEPHFSSDWAPFAALLLATRSRGRSTITDDVFLDRFQFTRQLRDAGLDNVSTRSGLHGTRECVEADIQGRPRLQLRAGPPRNCPDIRGSAALLLSALVTDGPVTLADDFHLRRGYRDLPGQLRQLGLAHTRCQPVPAPADRHGTDHSTKESS